MLSITHTFTEKDFDLIRQNVSQRMKTVITAKARWPFRLASIVGGVIFLVESMNLFHESIAGGVLCLLAGLLIICSVTAAPVLAWLILERERRAFKRRVGVSAKWDIDEAGVTFFSAHFPWASFRSYRITEAGFVLDGSTQMWIPESALSDTSLRGKVYEIIDRHLKRAA